MFLAQGLVNLLNDMCGLVCARVCEHVFVCIYCMGLRLQALAVQCA